MPRWAHRPVPDTALISNLSRMLAHLTSLAGARASTPMARSTSERSRTERVRAWSLTSSALMLLSALTAHAAPALPGQRQEVLPAVAPGDAVITVHGFCAEAAAAPSPSPSSACNTVVTRAQFDALAEALSPNMPRPLRLKVASASIRMMRMAAVAEARGLDTTAAFAEELRYAR